MQASRRVSSPDFLLLAPATEPTERESPALAQVFAPAVADLYRSAAVDSVESFADFAGWRFVVLSPLTAVEG